MSEDNTPQDTVHSEELLEDLPVSDDYDPALENIRKGFSFKQFVRDAPSIVFSLAVHAAALLILGICYLPVIVDFSPDLTANLEEIEELEDIDIFEEEPVEINLDETAEVSPMDTSMEAMETEMTLVEEPPKMEVATADLGNIMAPDALMTSMGELSGGDLSGRQKRGTAVAQGGGSEASERAVALGLLWIADHQLPNGAWCYTQMRNPNCRGKCKDTAIDQANKGSVSATAMALLPMLGSGITHKDGKYKKHVKSGLDYIASNCQMKPEGVVMCEKGANPPMYHHGLTTIVVCEAAAMTRDKNLEKLAQGAVNYIVWAQDPIGGGWRYTPKQPGDTSGMGWNFMALKSAQMAYLNVPPRTIKGAKHFLDNVTGIEGGVYYGYLGNTPEEKGRPALTSIGLLGQMYMGWKPDNPALIKGTDFLSKTGPQVGNLYYSYYATQVMHHVGGEKWDRWNKKLRDDLVKAQSTDGHEKGSWTNTGGGHLLSGGRLSSTAFATMILEVYYRHLPLYRKTSTVDAFPLD